MELITSASIPPDSPAAGARLPFDGVRQLGADSPVYAQAAMGRLRFRNKIMLAPMVTCLASVAHEVTDVMIRHYVRIAEGGAGAIIVESTLVNDNDETMAINELHLSSDRYIPGMTRLAEAISDAGAVPILQINCHDKYSASMPVERIARICHEFGQAAKRAKIAGFKAVEIHSCHNNFCCEILSPLTNKRDDKYGGTLKRNARFVADCIAEIKQQAGTMFPVIVRFNGREYQPGGITLAQSLELARHFQDSGATALHVSANGPPASNLAVITPNAKVGNERAGERSYPVGWLIEEVAGQIKRAVSIPVIGVSRIDSMAAANRYIENGDCDYVAIGRALLASPNMVNEGAASACIFVNHCTMRVIINKSIACVQNNCIGK